MQEYDNENKPSDLEDELFDDIIITDNHVDDMLKDWDLVKCCVCGAPIRLSENDVHMTEDETGFLCEIHKELR